MAILYYLNFQIYQRFTEYFIDDQDIYLTFYFSVYKIYLYIYVHLIWYIISFSRYREMIEMYIRLHRCSKNVSLTQYGYYGISSHWIKEIQVSKGSILSQGNRHLFEIHCMKFILLWMQLFNYAFSFYLMFGFMQLC